MNWAYTKRTDGRIALTLDNNVWNFLFDRQIDLALELPHESFTISITREVEIETLAIPPDAKVALKDFIDRSIAACPIKTTWVFGFSSERSGPQIYGGFGQGVWQSQTEKEFYEAVRRQYLLNKNLKKTGLSANQADAAVAAQSFFSIALTCELPETSGPLRFAAEHGGKVLYLPGYEASGLSLRLYIERFYAQI